MTRFLQACRGFCVGSLMILLTLLCAIVILLLSPLKLLGELGVGALRQPLRRLLNGIQSFWTWALGGIYRLLPRIDWQVQGLAPLRLDRWYFVIANHQSWVDILAIYHVLNFRVPVGKFFIKSQLLYVPIIGQAVYAIDFPFMKRYSKEQIARRPELRGKDLETTRKACAKYQHYPVSVINFLEGTRFTPAKHAASQSPYQHLLKPKSAGAAFVISALGQQMDRVLDMTLVYPGGTPTFWDFCCGRVRSIRVDIQLRDIPPHFCQRSYEDDPAFRQEFQAWINEIWRHKDETIKLLSSRRPSDA